MKTGERSKSKQQKKYPCQKKIKFVSFSEYYKTKRLLKRSLTHTGG